jgi:predicted dehydrogenase
MADRVRYGILSTAQIARNAHVPAARDAARSEVVAISSRDPARAERWAAELGIPKAYGSYEEILEDPEIDAVINTLPNSMHCVWTVRAAEAGKHILCEKPLAVTVEEAHRMIDAARANGVVLMEAFSHPFNPVLPVMQQVIASGQIGEVKLIRAELLYTIQDWENDSRVKKELGGGALLDAGCYCVNVIRTLMGMEPSSVQAYAHIRESHDVDTTFTGLLRFPGDKIGYMATGMEQPFRFTCEVIGTEGEVRTDNVFDGTHLEVNQGQVRRVINFNPVNRFRRQLEHFSHCVLTGASPPTTARDSLYNTATLVALKEAAREGHWVVVNPELR